MKGYVIYTTAKDEQEVERLKNELFKLKIVACIQHTMVKSTCEWQNKLSSANEFLLIIKTFDYLVPLIEKSIKEIHSYMTPEILGHELNFVSKEYLEWMKTITITEEEANVRLKNLHY